MLTYSTLNVGFRGKVFALSSPHELDSSVLKR